MSTLTSPIQQTSTSRAVLTIVAAFAVVSFAFAPALFCWPALYRPLAKTFGWNFASANLGGSIVLLLIGILSPAIGILADRFTPKAVILGGISTVAAGLALLSSVNSLPAYYACCFLLGLGVSAVSIVPCSVLIGPSISRWPGTVVGVINAGIGLGGYLAPRFTAAQILQRGIPGTFLALAASMAVPFLLVLLLVRDWQRPRSAAASDTPSLRDLVRMPMFWLYGLALFLCAHAMLGVQQNLISSLTGAHVAPKDAASILSIALVAAVPGKILSGILADRASARSSILASIFCVALGIALLLRTQPQSHDMYSVAFVFGLGYGGIFNAVPTLVFERFGTHRIGKSLGLFYLFFGLGTASGGELAGHLFDRTRDWTVPFQVDLVLATLSLVLLLATRRLTDPRNAGKHIPPR